MKPGRLEEAAEQIIASIKENFDIVETEPEPPAPKTPAKEEAGASTDEALKCPECSTDINETMKSCPKCGVEFEFEEIEVEETVEE